MALSGLVMVALLGMVLEVASEPVLEAASEPVLEVVSVPLTVGARDFQMVPSTLPPSDPPMVVVMVPELGEGSGHESVFDSEHHSVPRSGSPKEQKKVLDSLSGTHCPSSSVRTTR